MRGDLIEFDHHSVGNPSIKTVLSIGIITIVIVILFGAVLLMLSTNTNTPTPTPAPAIIIDNTPTPTPIPTPTPTPAPEMGDYPDARNQTYLWDFENNTYKIVNVTPIPVIPDSIQDARDLGWTPDLGKDADTWLYDYNLAHGYITPRPKLTLQILHEDKTPYDFAKEALLVNNTYSGYLRFKNVGDYPYQGDITVVINASLLYGDMKLHMENNLTSEQLSLVPGQSVDIHKLWNQKSISNNPIPTGVYEITIELRWPEDGSTIYSMTIRPQVAIDKNNNGYISF